MASSAKLAARSAGVSASAYSLASQKRSSEKGRSGSSSVSGAWCSLQGVLEVSLLFGVHIFCSERVIFSS